MNPGQTLCADVYCIVAMMSRPSYGLLDQQETVLSVFLSPSFKILKSVYHNKLQNCQQSKLSADADLEIRLKATLKKVTYS